MRLFAFGGSIGALVLSATVLGLTAERPVLPTCDADLVKKIIDAEVSQATPNLIVSGLSDIGGEMREDSWRCAAMLSTARGPIPIKYSLGLVGPGNLKVSMEASLPRD